VVMSVKMCIPYTIPSTSVVIDAVRHVQRFIPIWEHDPKGVIFDDKFKPQRPLRPGLQTGGLQPLGSHRRLTRVQDEIGGSMLTRVQCSGALFRGDKREDPISESVDVNGYQVGVL
jgi:hypothetical protein